MRWGWKRCVCLGLGALARLLAWAGSPAHAADSLSVVAEPEQRPLVRHSWYPIPIAFYQEETSVGFGVAGGYYFKSRSLKEVSSITGSVIYTLRRQAKLNVNPRFYTRDGRFHFLGNLQLRYYPEKYYGIGAGAPREGVDYISRAVSANFQPFYRFRPELEAGLVANARAESVPQGEAKSLEARLAYGGRNEAGWTPYFQWGLGLQLVYDTRDNLAYPQRFSHFLKVGWISYLRAWGCTYTMHSLSLDFRQFVPTWVGQVFAWQARFETRLGREVPFGMLPSLGGSDLLRGFRERMYAGNTLLAVQAEYRVPVWRRLKAAVFCSAGNVLDVYRPEASRVKIGYGAGLRLRLNDARVHLRFDVAGNNDGQVKFYITATEAF